MPRSAAMPAVHRLRHRLPSRRLRSSSLAAVIESSVVDISKEASRAFLLVPFYMYLPFPLGTLSAFTSRPTAMGSLTQCRQCSCRRRRRPTPNTICVDPMSVPLPLISSIPESMLPLPISSNLKSIPCHLFDCWVIVAVDAIAQRRCHRDSAGSSRSSAGGPSQTPDNANNKVDESIS